MRDRPQQNHRLEWPGGVVPEWARPAQGKGKRRGKKGAPGANSKRERLQKVMAQSGHGSRRNIEILIAQGHITINGQIAKLGDSVGPSDKVKLDGNVINLRFGDPLPRVLVYHKNAGEIVSRDDPQKRPTVFDRLPKVNGGRWVSVGRLDFNTEGLLIFTTSGELANRLTHPRFEVEREYAVRLLGELGEEQKEKLLAGVDIDGELCKFDALEDRGGEGANHWYHVILREGKNREVRRMMEAVGLTVSRLLRVRFGCVELPGHVKRGQLREMDEEQVQVLLNFAGMNEPPPAADADEEDEFDNIGNRGPDREPVVEDELEDDLGNRIDTREVAPPREADGNRGTYGEGYHAPQRDPQQRRDPQGGRGKKRGRGQGQGRGEADGNVMRAQGHGGNANGNVGHHSPGQSQGHGAGHGQGQGQHPKHKRKHGQGKPHPQGGQGAGNGPAPQAQGQPGHNPGQGQGPAKPGRHRRHKNRNRNRGAQDARPQGGNQAPVTGGGGED